jgi:enamine deaminase RidA (YjgF/YER057c/UK114 family)
MSKIAEKLAALGIDLPAAPAPVANYVPFTMRQGLVHVAGQVSRAGDGTLVTGKLGDTLDIAAGQAAARLCAINLMAQLANAAGGDLDRLRAVLKLNVFVNVVPSFGQIPQVANGCSDLFVEVFGDIGRHARSAVGVANLPMDSAVEIDGVFEIA